MKKLILFILFISPLKNCFSQFTHNYCNSPRYDTEVFTGDSISGNIMYGSNIDYLGSTTTLTMDIYTPSGDTAAIRPLIIWVHGGGFIGGTKNDGDVTSLCHHFAKRGYVCASINYRLGVFPTQVSATQGVYRAVQDLKAAIRFFRKNAATTNTFKIDPDMIFAGGSSAGAFTSLHLAYLDQPSEVPSYIDTTVLGGLEGSSGNPGYSSHVNAIVNLCGALGDTAWIHPGDVPVCSMHGTNDVVVPYATDLIYVLGNPIMVVNGSYSISQHANAIGLPNVMYTFYGAQHVPFSNNTAYMDTTVRFVSNFLYSYMGCTPTDMHPFPNTFINVSTADLNSTSDEPVVYPNPAFDYVTIQADNSAAQKAELADVTGRTIQTFVLNSSHKTIVYRGDLSAGLYFLKIYLNGKTITKKVCFQ